MSILKSKSLVVQSVMLDLDLTPQIHSRALLKEALELMDEKRLGIICVINSEGSLEGIITDGDIRRMLTKVQKPVAALFSDDVIDHAIKDPTTVNSKTPLFDAISIMESRRIWDLPVINQLGKLEGLLHLHPAIKAVMGVQDV